MYKIAGLILLQLSSATWASETLPSRLSLDFGLDEENGRSTTLDVDYALMAEFRLALSASRSESVDFDSERFRIALESDPLAPAQIGLSYESWDSEGEFTIDTIGALFSVYAEQWSLSISPVQRDIKIAATNWRGQPIEVSLSSTGLTLSLSHFMPNGFQVGLSYSLYDYSKDVTQLDPARRPVLTSFISPIALSQAQGLDDHNLYLDLGYLFETTFFGLTIGQSQSAVDEQKTHMVLINSAIPLTDEWELGVSVGRQKSEDDAITFGNMGLTLYW